MASLFKQPRSPFWYIAYRDPKTRQRQKKPTPYRWNDRAQTRAARELCAKRTHEEKKIPRALAQERWPAWVRPFLEQRYYGREETRDRYLTIWKTIEAFLENSGWLTPSAVDHQAVMEYVATRRKEGRAPGTIALEVKVLRRVIDEAIKRGWAGPANPCARLGLSRKPLRELSEIRDEEDQIICEALRLAPEWMQVSYEIAMAHGCRFSATRLNLSRDVSLPLGKVLFHEKGGKVFEVDMVPSLRPLFERLIREGKRWTWDLPPGEMRQTGRNWTRFFVRTGLPHLWFHCTRATAITRAHRAGVRLPEALRFFGHSGKTLVHFIYSRLGTEDTSAVAQAMSRRPVSAYDAGPSASTRSNRSSGNADAPRATPSRRPRSSGRRIGKRTGRRRIAALR